MKKIISIILCAVLVCGMFTACSAKSGEEKENGKISIVCTVFPIYDWVMNVLGDKAENADERVSFRKPEEQIR